MNASSKPKKGVDHPCCFAQLRNALTLGHLICILPCRSASLAKPRSATVAARSAQVGMLLFIVSNLLCCWVTRLLADSLRERDDRLSAFLGIPKLESNANNAVAEPELTCER